MKGIIYYDSIQCEGIDRRLLCRRSNLGLEEPVQQNRTIQYRPPHEKQRFGLRLILSFQHQSERPFWYGVSYCFAWENRQFPLFVMHLPRTKCTKVTQCRCSSYGKARHWLLFFQGRFLTQYEPVGRSVWLFRMRLKNLNLCGKKLMSMSWTAASKHSMMIPKRVLIIMKTTRLFKRYERVLNSVFLINGPVREGI